MKKMMFSVLCVVCALTATAQEVTKRVKVPGFSGISAESVFDITLVRANKCAVEIFCPKEIEEALDIKVSGGDLVLRLNTDRLDRKERRNFRGGVRAVVSIPALERLQLSGAARLSTTSVFEGSDFVMGLSGASSATGLNFSGGRLRAQTSGGAGYDIKGTFEDVSLGLSGGSRANLNLTAGSLKIDASGGANIDMAVKCEQIVIGMSGGACITASGETGALKASGSGGAHLEAVGLKANDVTLGGSGAAGSFGCSPARPWASDPLGASSIGSAGRASGAGCLYLPFIPFSIIAIRSRCLSERIFRTMRNTISGITMNNPITTASPIRIPAVASAMIFYVFAFIIFVFPFTTLDCKCL